MSTLIKPYILKQNNLTNLNHHFIQIMKVLNEIIIQMGLIIEFIKFVLIKLCFLHISFNLSDKNLLLNPHPQS